MQYFIKVSVKFIHSVKVRDKLDILLKLSHVLILSFCVNILVYRKMKSNNSKFS